VDSCYTEDELKGLGLKAYGTNVRLSRKASLYGAENVSLGDHVRIDDFCILSGNIEIGNYVHIAAYTAIYGGSSGVSIGDFANLSSRISVYSVSDDYSGETMTNPTVPDRYKNIERNPVKIERHVIVGSTSVILPGTTLREGSSFGSFTLIDHDSEAWSINVGIPFRKIKNRSRDLLRLEKEFLREISL